RRLARTGLADQPHTFAGVDVDADLVQHGFGTTSGSVVDFQVGNAQQRLRGRHLSAPCFSPVASTAPDSSSRALREAVPSMVDEMSSRVYSSCGDSNSVLTSFVSSTSPALITTTRSQMSATTPKSWVTMTSAIEYSDCSSRSSSSTSAWTVTSRAVVG